MTYTGLSINIEVCGNNVLDSSTATCEETNIGVPSPGEWDHFVVNIQFSHTAGSVSVWRSGVSVLTWSNVVTSYRNSQTPTLAIGVYVDSWDTLSKMWSSDYVTWIEMHFRRLKVGGVASSYDEVYTGASGDFSMGTEFLGSVSSIYFLLLGQQFVHKYTYILCLSQLLLLHRIKFMN